MNEIKYCNEMLVRLEELLFQELSGCAAWKVEMVGVDFIQAQDIKGQTPDEVIESCIDKIKAAGLAQEMEYKIGGRGVKLDLTMKGCVHMPKEIQLKQNGVKPYICPLTNMVLDQLIEKLGFETSYVAAVEIDEHQGRCQTLSAIYENVDKIGCVSDWSKE